MAESPVRDEYEDLCTMVGNITLTWAWVESALALMIVYINEKAGPIAGFDDAPNSLDSKVKCFKIGLRDTPALDGVRERGRQLAVSIKALGKRRNDFIHGAAWQTSEKTFDALLIGVKDRKYVFTHKSFDKSDAITLHREIADLGIKVATLAGEIKAILKV